MISRMFRLAGTALLISATAVPVWAQAAAPHLFRIVGAKDEAVIGLTAEELSALGAGPEVERIARKLVADGQITAWQYVVGRGPDGATRYATTRRIAVLKNDAIRVEPYTAALPVSAPPAQ